NIAIECCKNIVLKNLEIRHAHPDMHELKAINVSSFYVDFEIDKDSLYKIENKKLYFYSKDYCCAADKNALNAHWIGLIRSDFPDRLKRVSNPLLGAVKLQNIGDRKIRAYYINTLRFKPGDCFYLFDVRRQFAGIFVNQCENVVLDSIKQRFNYSLALVLQDSKDISMINSEFAPERNSARKMASVADFIQVCMCRGNIRIENNYFDGSGDDCLNVHGVHYKIVQIKENKIVVRFMHHQSHGYNPFHNGDEIAFVNTKTLLEHGNTKIINSKLINEYEIELVVESAQEAVSGEVIENVSGCPDVYFAENTLNRIITRGCLFTTRGKVVVDNNHFKSTSMSGVHLSDDAKHWYESGMCCDVTIKNNTFDYCGQTPISIKPENEVHKGAVHKNIRILNNNFKSYKGYCIRAKSTDNIRIKGNIFNSDKIVKCINCQDVDVEG
ncbi:MAG: right-handed parallel beta-helix repeat-containing protein, partial [Eubacterium sp.]|nr:right-handed parallel beta-helix repeat-containing protein [Eubacterium sp.]